MADVLATPSPLGVGGVADSQEAILMTVVNHNTNPLAAGNAPHPDLGEDPGCALFEFVLKVGLIGALCLLGFAGNTLSFVVLWRERSGSAMTFLLQAVLLADLAVVWMLFIRDVVPALGYVVPLLRDCATVCGHVAAVTRPLLFLARACVVWLLLHAAASRYLTLSRPSSLASIGTVDCARKQVVLTVLTAFIFSIPLTFDSMLHVLHYPDAAADVSSAEAIAAAAGAAAVAEASGGTPIVEPLVHNRWYRTIYLYVVQFALLLLAPLLVVAFLAARLLQLLRSMRRLRRALVPLHRTQSAELTQVVLTLCVTLLVCYLPVTVLFVLEWAHGAHVDAACGHLIYYLQDFASMFLALNSSIKVLILALFVERFGRGVKGVFCGGKGGSYESVQDSDTGLGMYKCQDMSEMTLISQVDGRV